MKLELTQNTSGHWELSLEQGPLMVRKLLEGIVTDGVAQEFLLKHVAKLLTQCSEDLTRLQKKYNLDERAA